ncbi:MAG: polyprenyl synthetase family protein [Candidatus Woesearchaeota archaeon]
MDLLDFKKELIAYKNKIDDELESFFDCVISNNKLEFNKQIIEAIKEFTLRGGKRIRPLLVLKGFLAYCDVFTCDENSSKINDVLKAAICVELMQSSFLIHDDIMDSADIRRNKKTVHKIFESGSQAKKQAENMAILAGNVSMILGEKAIINSNFSDEIKLKAMKKFNEIVETTNYGQVLDLQLSGKCISEVSEEDIDQIHLLKTAKYTIEGPLQLGALLNDADEKLLQELSDISILLGRAFQIKDDILGVFGDEEKLGKSVFSDIAENKKTLLIWFAYNNADEDKINENDDSDKKFIKIVLGKKDIIIEDFERLKKIIIDTGSLKYSTEKINCLMDESKKLIISSNINKETKEFLLNLSDYLIKRDY